MARLNDNIKSRKKKGRETPGKKIDIGTIKGRSPKRLERESDKMLTELDKERGKRKPETSTGSIVFKEYATYVRRAMEQIGTGHIRAAIPWLREAVDNIEMRAQFLEGNEKRKQLLKAANVIEGAVNKIIKYPNGPEYKEIAASLYEEWLVPRYKALSMYDNVVASKDKAFTIKHKVAREKGFHRLVEFYINEGLDDFIEGLFKLNLPLARNFRDILDLETTDYQSLSKTDRKRKIDRQDEMWGALYLAAEHFANKDPRLTSYLCLKMGEMARSMGDAGKNYSIASDYFRKSVRYMKKVDPEYAEGLGSKLKESGYLNEGAFKRIVKTLGQ